MKVRELEGPPEPVTRGVYFPHQVGNTRSRGVRLPISNISEDSFVRMLDSIPHSEWKHPGCICSECMPRRHS